MTSPNELNMTSEQTIAKLQVSIHVYLYMLEVVYLQMIDLKDLVITGNLLWKCLSSWNCVIVVNTDKSKDQRALAKICLNVRPCCYTCVRIATTAKEAWDSHSLQSSFENKILWRRLSLLRRLLRTKFEDISCMAKYINGLTAIVQRLADNYHAVNDKELAMLLLGGPTSEYEPLIMGIKATHTS